MSREFDEQQLVKRAKAGDTRAYGLIVAQYQQLAFRVAYVICGSAQDAEEAAQDGFIKAFRALNRFRERSPFRPWLLRIVANEAHNRRRAEGRRATVSLERVGDSLVRGSGVTVDEAPATDETDAVRRALVTLNERDRQVIFLRYFLNLSEAETAAALGCRVGTAKSRLSRALAHLREAVQQGEQHVNEGEQHG